MNIQIDRMLWLDICKGLLITLVVAGHIVWPDGSTAYTGGVNSWIYSFHIPAFFIISGFLKTKTSYLSKVLTFRDALAKQSKTIRYYFLFSIIFFIRYTCQYFAGLNTLEDLWNFVYNTLLANGMAALWFLPTFVFAELIFFIVYRNKKYGSLTYALLLAITLFLQYKGLICYPENEFDVMEMILFLAVRVLFCSLFVFVGYFIGMMDLLNTSFRYLGILSVFCLVNGYTNDIRTLRLGDNPFLYIIFAILGTLFVILISKIISTIKYNNIISKALSTWGKYSLLIMCTHTIFMVVKCSTYLVFRILPYDAFVADTLITIIVMLVETIIIMAWKRLEVKYSFLNL